MIAPFSEYSGFGELTTLLLALVIGVAFGFFLERAGFGSARKLVSQFYLDDMAVFKTMFTAIVTAMVGVAGLAWAGVLDLSLVYLTPTFLAPQVVGGLILGVGFVVGGYCPGTSIAAAATGKIDGLVCAAGIFAGMFVFSEAFPWVKAFYLSTDMGETTLPQALGLPYGLVVVAVVAMALGGFYGATLVERAMAARRAD